MRTYFGTREVQQRLRKMTDSELEAVFVKGLRERKRGGPKDGDQERSNHLMRLVEQEMDRRFDLGPSW